MIVIKSKLKILIGTIVIVIAGSLLWIFAPSFIKQTGIVNPPISYSQPEYQQSKEDQSVQMLFVGDVMLARSIGDGILNGNDPFVNIKSKFKDYDVVVANLETTVSDPIYAYENPTKLYTFNSPVESLDVLKNSGISVVSLANNHTMDYGANALKNTMNNLKSKGILYVGSGENISDAFAPKYLYINKTRIAIVAYNDIETWITNVTDSTSGSAYFDKDLIKSSLAEAKQNADIVIVFPHWGEEYNLQNSERQADYGHFFIDNGADIVIGSHPHVLQNTEEYAGKQIFYSMGNFVFDDMCPIPNACNAGIVEVNINNATIESANLIKVKLADNGYPELE